MCNLCMSRSSLSSRRGSSNETSDEDVDYYAYAQNRQASPVRERKRKSKRNSFSEDQGK